MIKPNELFNKYPTGPNYEDYNYIPGETVVHIITGFYMWIVNVCSEDSVICRLPDLTEKKMYTSEIMSLQMFKEKFPDREVEQYKGAFRYEY